MIGISHLKAAKVRFPQTAKLLQKEYKQEHSNA